MNHFLILTHAVLVGLTPLIPIPVLDDLVKSFFYRNMVKSLAAAYGASLSSDEIARLAEEQSSGCLNGCLFRITEYWRIPSPFKTPFSESPSEKGATRRLVGNHLKRRRLALFPSSSQTP